MYWLKLASIATKKIWGEGSLFTFYLKMDNHGFSSVDTN